MNKEWRHDEQCEADWGIQGQESPCNCSERPREVPLTFGVGGKRIGSAFLGKNGLAQVEITDDTFLTNSMSLVSDYSIYINDKAASVASEWSLMGERSIVEISTKLQHSKHTGTGETMSETWQDAYQRIMAEVEADMPDADEADQYTEYRARCEAWKHEKGIR